jgi:hypothetical protein
MLRTLLRSGRYGKMREGQAMSRVRFLGTN